MIASASSCRLAHTTVSTSLEAGIVANAVPHEPAPTTATFMKVLLPALRVARTQVVDECPHVRHHLVGHRVQRLLVVGALRVVGGVERRGGLHPDGTGELQ